jgi:RHS repeat-associated protein
VVIDLSYSVRAATSGSDTFVQSNIGTSSRYTGGYLDTATGMYKLGARYYDPTLGRFTQTDPTGQDPHYTYAGNDPCNYVDPTGTARRCGLAGAAGGVLGGLVGGAAGFAVGGPAGAVVGAGLGAGGGSRATADACRSRARTSTGRARDAALGLARGVSDAGDALTPYRIPRPR